MATPPDTVPRLAPQSGAAAPSRPMGRMGRFIGVLAVLAVLMGVMALYQQPDFLLMLTGMVWGCFG